MKFYISDKDDEMKKQTKDVLEKISLSVDDPLVEVEAINPITKEPMVLRVRKSVLESGSTVST